MKKVLSREVVNAALPKERVVSAIHLEVRELFEDPPGQLGIWGVRVESGVGQ